MRQSTGKKFNIEAVFGGDRIALFFLGSQEIDEQGRQTRAVQDVGHKTISRAVTTAAAAMGKDHSADCGWRNCKHALDDAAGSVDLDQVFESGSAFWVRCSLWRPGSHWIPL